MGFLVFNDSFDEYRYQLAESEVEAGGCSIPIIPEAPLEAHSSIPKYCSFQVVLGGEKKRVWARLEDVAAKTGLTLDAARTIDQLPHLAKAVIDHQKVEKALKKVFGDEEAILKWAPTLSQFVKQAKDQQIDIRLSKSKVPFDGAVHINKDGKIFIDLKKSQMGKGNARKFKQALDLFRGKVVARGVSVEINSEEFQVLKELSGKVGIVETDSSALFTDKNGKTKGALFQPVYVMNLFEARQGEYRNEVEWTRDEKVDLAKQLLQGLASIAEKGVHRDIKLENILVQPGQKKVAISDFGLFSRGERHPTGGGTATYMAPEILEDPYANSKPADVWAMGLVLYQLFHEDCPDWMVGLRPEEVKETVSALREGWQREELKQLNLQDPIDKLIYHMLEVDPRKRPTAALLSSTRFR